MDLYQVIEGDDAIEFCETKMNLSAPKFDLSRVKRVEIFSANIADDGEDFCELRALDSGNQVIAVQRVLSF